MIEFIIYFSQTIVCNSIMMFFVWILYLIIRNPYIVEIVKPIGIVISGIIYLQQTSINKNNLIISILLIIWAVRLISFLFITRILKKKIDDRYLLINKSLNSMEEINFFIIYQIQAIILCVIAIPFYLAFKVVFTPGILFFMGAIITSLSIIGETIADLQLYNFKQRYPKILFTKRLWYYSRHPNYFFELGVWLGFSMLVIQKPVHMLIFISPLTLFILMYFLLIPLTEKHMMMNYNNINDYKKQTRKLLILPNYKN